MELEGRKGLVDTGKSSRTCNVPTISLCLAVLDVFQGFFGPKMAAFGPKLQLLKLRSATCESRSRPPPLSFLLNLCVIVFHTHRYHPPKFQPNLKLHDRILIFPHFAHAACLLAACCLLACLLAAKPGRSTLDTKKGYKTKAGSTSSVTLTLTLTPPPPHPLAGHPHDPRPDPPPTPGRNPPPPDPREEHPPPPAGRPPNCPLPPPLRVLKDSWGPGRIRTGCGHPPVLGRLQFLRCCINSVVLSF